MWPQISRARAISSASCQASPEQSISRTDQAQLNSYSNLDSGAINGARAGTRRLSIIDRDICHFLADCNFSRLWSGEVGDVGSIHQGSSMHQHGGNGARRAVLTEKASIGGLSHMSEAVEDYAAGLAALRPRHKPEDGQAEAFRPCAGRPRRTSRLPERASRPSSASTVATYER
jgi:hypothetical protein